MGIGRVSFHGGLEMLAFAGFALGLAEQIFRLHHGSQVQPAGQRAARCQGFCFADEQDEGELRGLRSQGFIPARPQRCHMDK